MKRRASLIASSILLIAFLLISFTHAASYQYGDFVSTSRRGQFKSSRTPWQELLGRHCPLFAKDHDVVIPIPQPIGFDSVDEYKVSLSFDQERFLLPWLKIVGRGAPSIPMLLVTLQYTGDEIRHVSAEVHDVPLALRRAHPHLAAEWSNATHWPKHLLLSYQWQDTREFDSDAGLMLAFVLGISGALFLATRVVVTNRNKLQEFFDQVVPDMGEGVMEGDGGYVQYANQMAATVSGMGVPGLGGAMYNPFGGGGGGGGQGAKRD